MRYIHIFATFFIISLFLFFTTGCKHEAGEAPLSTKPTVEVTIDGKVWEIDPNLSYQATGVWTNSNPRPLTDAEKRRLQALRERIQTLEAQFDELDKELRYLERIEAPEIKIQYSFGLPPRFSQGGNPNIIDLGECPMQMDMPEKIGEQP